MNPSYTLVTGGAGFVGSNLADRLLDQGGRVLLLDDLSRGHVSRNVEWLAGRHGDRVRLMRRDVADAGAVRDAVGGAEAVFHFAGQVAVTTSLRDPVRDFEVNARGTLNVLEAVRALDRPVPIVFTSTNKVYGEMDDVDVRLVGDRYTPADDSLDRHGVGEDRRLSFHSPYGCSKGSADQYVLDYANTFGLKATVLRMSCIYGPRQFGTEDQGWVAHFLLRALFDEPITIFGDGRQVRDALFVGDLVDAFLRARDGIDALSGSAFNIGGGPDNSVSLLELLDIIESLMERRPDARFADWRRADQRWYVSDTRRFQQATGWKPRVRFEDGVASLHDWLANLSLEPV